jgi:hypothetical protein
MKLKVDMSQIKTHAEELILQFATAKIGGERKKKAVVRELSEWLDDRLTFGPGPIGRLAEAADGPVLRMILGLIVEEVYKSLSKAGKV